MPRTPDRYGGGEREDEGLILDDRGVAGDNAGDPAVVGGVRYVDDSFRCLDADGVFDPGNMRREAGSPDAVKPRNDGEAIKIYDAGGTLYALLRRTTGNFAITVVGTDAQALYQNAKIVQIQLGGLTAAQRFTVVDGGDGEIFEAEADGQTIVHRELELRESGQNPGAQGGFRQNGGDLLARDQFGVFNLRELPIPDNAGQVLFAIDATAFVKADPVTSEEGWLVNGDGVLIVSG